MRSNLPVEPAGRTKRSNSSVYALRMPRPRFTQLPEHKRRRILDAAAAEFAQHGFAAASYNRIIRSAGVSKGAMYYYFDDKEDLFLATVDDALARGQLAFGSLDAVLGAREPVAFWAAISELSARAWSIFQRDPVLLGLGKALLASSERGPASAAYSDLVEGFRGAIDELIAAGVRIGAIRDDLDLGLLSAAMLGMGEAIDRYLLARMETMRPDDLSEFSELAALPQRLVDLFVRVAAPAPALSRLVLGATRSSQDSIDMNQSTNTEED